MPGLIGLPTTAWRAHFRWLEEMKFSQPVQQIVFQEYVDTVKMLSKRVAALDQQLESAANQSVFWPVIEGLMALRGVNLLTAAMIAAEIGDLQRFACAPQLMAYLGVVPSEHSSGATKSRGGITDRQWPCAPGAGGGGLDLSPSGPQDQASATLMPDALQDWLPEGHLAYFISDAVDQLDLSAFHSRYAKGGPRNQPFHPAMMVKVLVYATSACSKPRPN